MIFEETNDEYRISTDRRLLDLTMIHGFLKAAYWCEGIPSEVIQRSIENSLCFGIYNGKTQVGFARVITDYATFAYIGDVFVLESHRGRGLSKWLMQAIVEHPELQGFRRWLLATRDAHGLYKQFGFKPLKSPDRFIERWSPNLYKKT
ncbi:GNAT family N-acetyltransferase [Candidatus Acetothermia bacterium]|nr:GNAT family N-acetyltransferase [Candidatus Acetothermia bacterium]MBI3643017.1 GNAT family N-acetyltransferase [Candidatus Acetothermia bacterium]